jgi:hypothetical protein
LYQSARLCYGLFGPVNWFPITAPLRTYSSFTSTYNNNGKVDDTSQENNFWPIYGLSKRGCGEREQVILGAITTQDYPPQPPDNNLVVQNPRLPDFSRRLHSANTSSSSELYLSAKRREFSILALVPCLGWGDLLDEFVKLPQRNEGGRRRKEGRCRKLIRKEDSMTSQG